MTRGDGVSIITEGGTGDWDWVGTGFRLAFGGLHGSTGTGDTIIYAGVR